MIWLTAFLGVNILVGVAMVIYDWVMWRRDQKRLNSYLLIEQAWDLPTVER